MPELPAPQVCDGPCSHSTTGTKGVTKVFTILQVIVSGVEVMPTANIETPNTKPAMAPKPNACSLDIIFMLQRPVRFLLLLNLSTDPDLASQKSGSSATVQRDEAKPPVNLSSWFHTWHIRRSSHGPSTCAYLARLLRRPGLRNSFHNNQLTMAANAIMQTDATASFSCACDRGP